MITAARLRDYNPRIRQMMRTYTSSHGNKYEAGNGIVPSTWRIIKNPIEIAELSAESQFQIMQFENQPAFDAFIQGEMENDARMGKPPVRAAVRKDENTIPMSREADEARSAKNQSAAIRQAAVQMLRPTPVGEPIADEPEPEPEPEPELIKEVKHVPAKKTGRRAAKKKK